MARLEDIPEPTRSAVADIACPSFDTSPFVAGPALSRRRVALVSSAALIRRGDKPFPVGSGEHRAVPDSWPSSDILVSHDRLRELAAEGVIGSVASTHYSVMGSTDPAAMVESADAMAAALHADAVDAVVLSPV